MAGASDFQHRTVFIPVIQLKTGDGTITANYRAFSGFTQNSANDNGGFCAAGGRYNPFTRIRLLAVPNQDKRGGLEILPGDVTGGFIGFSRSHFVNKTKISSMKKSWWDHQEKHGEAECFP